MESRRQIFFDKLKKVCLEAKRDENSLQIIAVSKKQSVERIQKMYDLGQKVFAENYVLEFLEKKVELPQDIKWHLIGPLQTNKASKIIGLVDLIQSVGSLKLAEHISKISVEKKIKQKVLIQINIAEEKSKSGINPDEAARTILEIANCKNLVVCGLMTMPPFTDKPENSRVYFKKLKELQLNLCKEIETLRELSMGTSQDYEVAIQEGATMIRIGEALFGPRN